MYVMYIPGFPNHPAFSSLALVSTSRRTTWTCDMRELGNCHEDSHSVSLLVGRGAQSVVVLEFHQ